MKLQKTKPIIFYSQISGRKGINFGFCVGINMLKGYAFKKKLAKHFTVSIKNATFAKLYKRNTHE